MATTHESTDPTTLYPTASTRSLLDKDYQKDTKTDNSWIRKSRDFLHWIFTPLGFCIAIYGLNVIAWGGMLFLLMCNAAPAMCHPNCNSLSSSRRIWIEIDSQILNALFCVTGLGLAPWRLRDLYFWTLWRLGWSEQCQTKGLNRLAQIHGKWSLLDSSQSMVLPTSTTLKVPCTPLWKMDAVVWGNVLNTVFQICLATCMWAMNRLNRPSWTTGLFVCLACLVAGVAGVVMWLEKRRIQKADEQYKEATLLVSRPSSPDSMGSEQELVSRGD